MLPCTFTYLQFEALTCPAMALTVPCLVLTTILLSHSKQAGAAPKFQLINTEYVPKEANEAGKNDTEYYPK